MEVGSADALPDDVPVGAAGHEVHLLLHHDVLQLRAYLTHLIQVTRNDKYSLILREQHQALDLRDDWFHSDGTQNPIDWV